MTSTPPSPGETLASPPTPRKPPTPVDGRDDFVAAALALCDRQGPEAVTARNVAKEMGKSPMAVYRHFRSMNHLIATVWNAAFAMLQRETEAACRQIGDPAAELRQCLISYLEFGIAHPQLAWFIIVTRPHPERYAMDDLGRQGFARLVAVIRRGMQAGCFREDLDPEEAALNASYLMVGMTSFIVAKAVSGGTHPDQTQRLEKTVDWFLEDLRPRS